MSFIIQNSRQNYFQQYSQDTQQQKQQKIKYSQKFIYDVFFDNLLIATSQKNDLFNYKSQQRQQIISIRNNPTKQTIEIRIAFVKNLLPETIDSKDQSIIVLKDLQMKSFVRHFFYVNIKNGQIVMSYQQKLSLHHLQKVIHQRKKLKIYLGTIIKKFLRDCENLFSEIMTKFQKKLQKNTIPDVEDLKAILNLSSINPHFEISSEMISNDEKLQKNEAQKIQLNKLFKEIDNDNEKIKCLYLFQSSNIQKIFKEKQNIEKFIYKQKLLLNYYYQEESTQSNVTVQDFLFNCVKINELNFMMTIGQGGSSQIILAKAQLNFVNSEDYKPYSTEYNFIQKMIAVKKYNHEKFKKKIQHENSILKLLKGQRTEYLPKYFGVQQKTTFSETVLMEQIVGQDLSKYFKFYRQVICFYTKLGVLLNIIFGLKLLAKAQIVHLDIKPENIMVSNKLITKIIDFGDAYHRSICNKQFQPGFTFPYAAPETFNKLHLQHQKKESNFQYSQKQDVFALGHIIAESVFNNKLHTLPLRKYPSVYLSKEPISYIHYAPERAEVLGEYDKMQCLFLLMMRCLDDDPSKRPYVDWIGVLFKNVLQIC